MSRVSQEGLMVLMVLRGSSGDEPGEPGRAHGAQVLRRNEPGEPLSQEDFLGYIDLELDALTARVQLISYRYILL